MSTFELWAVLFIFIVVILAILFYRKKRAKMYENYARALGEMQEQEHNDIRVVAATLERLSGEMCINECDAANAVLQAANHPLSHHVASFYDEVKQKQK